VNRTGLDGEMGTQNFQSYGVAGEGKSQGTGMCNSEAPEGGDKKGATTGKKVPFNGLIENMKGANDKKESP